MTGITPLGLERAVLALCPEIEEECTGKSYFAHRSRFLWFRLVTAVLGSQVQYELAVSVSRLLWDRGLIPPLDQTVTTLQYESQILETLKQPVLIGDRLRRYRFPYTKASQIAATWHQFSQRGISLHRILGSGQHPRTLRNVLVSIVRGLGPKQASMFLRDVGITRELAIIDRHVLGYMAALRLADHSPKNVVSYSRYEALEDELTKYADFLGFSLGSVDWAIWLVMRTAKREYLA